MNTAQQTAPQQPAPANTSSGQTFEQRLHAVHEEIQAEQTSSQSAGDSAGADSEAAPPPSAAPVQPTADSGDVEKARAERAARLEALKAESRARVDERARKSAQDRIAQELERERQQRAALEQRAASMVDVTKLDAAGLYELAKKANVSPQALGEWIREAMTNPESVATQAATRALDPKFAELQQKLERQEQALQDMMRQQMAERQRAEAHAMTSQFLGYVGKSAERAPLAAKFLERHGATEFLKVAENAGASLPEHAGPDAVLDAIESFLDGDAREYAQQLAELYGIVPPSKDKQLTPPKSAAAKAKTVSNANAQERASVVQDDAFAKLSFEERVEAIKRAM